MARNIAWVVAALLLVPASGRAAGLHDVSICEQIQAPQQRVGQPSAGAKPDSKTDKPGDKRPELPKWWIDPKLRAELGITDQQSAAVERVWQKSSPSLSEGWEKLRKLEEVLSKLTDGSDEAAVIAQSDRVENLRAELRKGRTLMIYRMNKLLTPDQRAKVKAMYEHPDQGRRGSTQR
jgi:Spy/CpxP family protein refolding chaperone